MKRPEQTRREFLATSAVLLAGSAYASQPANGVVRRDVSSPAASADIQALATAYTQMLAISNSDPADQHGWVYQANIHGVKPYTDLGPDSVWNQCQHGNWWFFPWHRMYLYFFERIVRKLSGKTDFAIPYWYWDKTDGSQLNLPAPFISPGRLYIPNRSDTANQGNAIDDIQSILNDPLNGKLHAVAETNFYVSANVPGFGGPVLDAPNHFNNLHGLLEGDGHDTIHEDVGDWMANPLTSAKDPLFWLHHANIDRIWIEWLKMGNGRTNPNQQDPVGKKWYDPVFQFYDEKKMKVKISAKEVLQTIDLGYVYDMYPDFRIEIAGASAPQAIVQSLADRPARTVAEASPGETKLGDKPLRVALKLPEANRPHMEAAVRADNAFVNLTVQDIKVLKRDSHIRVYINLPDNAVIPGVDDSHYGGLISFFRHEHDGMGITATIPITETVRRLQKAGLWNKDQVIVTLVQARPGKEPKAFEQISIGKITLAVPEP